MTRKTALRTVGYVLFFFFLTAVFTVLNFPTENLTATVNGWLSETVDPALSAGEVSTVFPLSLDLRDISVDGGKNRQILGEALVSLDFPAFLKGDKGLKVKFEGPWGSSRFRVRSEGEGWGIEVGSLTARLGALPFLEEIPFKVEGTAEARGSLRAGNPSGKLIDGEGRITGKGIQLAEGLLEPFGLSPLNFSDLTVFFTVSDSVLTFGESVLVGDVSATARGTVRLNAAQPGNSRLDLIVEVTPGPDVKEAMTPLFSLMGVRPRTDGRVTVRIRGTVSRPSIKG
jgi:type II secretion system protein N